MSGRTAVVDASAIVALVFDEPEAESIARRVTGRRLAAPELLSAELANAAAVKVRRGALDATEAADALADADALAIDLYRIPPRAALVAALETGLTAYDAAYWLVARALSAELVTLDRALGRVAKAWPAGRLRNGN